MTSIALERIGWPIVAPSESNGCSVSGASGFVVLVPLGGQLADGGNNFHQTLIGQLKSANLWLSGVRGRGLRPAAATFLQTI